MNKIQFLSDLSVNEICYVERYIINHECYPFKNTGRQHHAFLYTVSGTETYYFDNKKISAVPGSILYIPKGEVYSIKLDGEISDVIGIDFETTDNTCRPFCVKLQYDRGMKNYFEQTKTIWGKKSPECIPMIKSLLFKITSMLIHREYTYSSPKNFDKIKKAVDYLHDHYLENSFRIENLFIMSDISPRYFETLFFKEFNMTPREYIISLKIAGAKELLRSEKYSVSDVASKLGYNDVCHFSKMFKSKTGLTPTEYKYETEKIN